MCVEVPQIVFQTYISPYFRSYVRKSSCFCQMHSLFSRLRRWGRCAGNCIKVYNFGLFHDFSSRRMASGIRRKNGHDDRRWSLKRGGRRRAGMTQQSRNAATSFEVGRPEAGGLRSGRLVGVAGLAGISRPLVGIFFPAFIVLENNGYNVIRILYASIRSLSNSIRSRLRPFCRARISPSCHRFATFPRPNRHACLSRCPSSANSTDPVTSKGH